MFVLACSLPSPPVEGRENVQGKPFYLGACVIQFGLLCTVQLMRPQQEFVSVLTQGSVFMNTFLPEYLFFLSNKTSQ